MGTVDDEAGLPQPPVGEPLQHAPPLSEPVDHPPAAADEKPRQLPEPQPAHEPAENGALDPETVAWLEAASAVSESLGLGYHLGGAIERIAIGASGGTRGV